MKPISVAFIGFGGIGLQSGLPAAIACGLKIVGFQSRRPATTLENARKKDLKIDFPGYSTIQELYDGCRPDAVIDVGPSGMHAGNAVFFGERGVDFLSEKPVGINGQQILDLFRVAGLRNARIGGIFQKALTPDFQLLLRAMREGRFGNNVVIQLYVPWYRPPTYYGIVGGVATSWKGTLALDGGGAAINQGSHHLDMGMRLLAAKFNLSPGECPIIAVRAKKANLLYTEIEGEDTFFLEGHTSDGTLLQFYSTTAADESGQMPVYDNWDFDSPLRRVRKANASITVTGSGGCVVLSENEKPVWSFATAAEYDQEIFQLGVVDSASSTASNPLALGYAGHQQVFGDFFANTKQESWRLKSTVLPLIVLFAGYKSTNHNSEIVQPISLASLDDGID